MPFRTRLAGRFCRIAPKQQRRTVLESDSPKQTCCVQTAAYSREDRVQPEKESNRNSIRRNKRLNERPNEPRNEPKTARVGHSLLQIAASTNLASLKRIAVRVDHGLGDCPAQRDRVCRFTLDHP